MKEERRQKSREEGETSKTEKVVKGGGDLKRAGREKKRQKIEEVVKRGRNKGET